MQSHELLQINMEKLFHFWPPLTYVVIRWSTTQALLETWMTVMFWFFFPFFQRRSSNFQSCLYQQLYKQKISKILADTQQLQLVFHEACYCFPFRMSHILTSSLLRFSQSCFLFFFWINYPVTHPKWLCSLAYLCHEVEDNSSTVPN